MILKHIVSTHGDGDISDVEGSIRRKNDIDKYIKFETEATLVICSAMTAITVHLYESEHDI